MLRDELLCWPIREQRLGLWAEPVGILHGIEQAEKEVQEIAEGCELLIKNSIICWKYPYLARRVEAARTPKVPDNILKIIALHSSKAWRHTNMLGEYNVLSDRLRNNTIVLPPKSALGITPRNWESPKQCKHRQSQCKMQVPMAESVLMLG